MGSIRLSFDDGGFCLNGMSKLNDKINTTKQKTSETVVVLRWRVVEEYYSSEGAVETEFELVAGGPVCALNIPAGQWHTLRALDPGTVILEMKDGPYEPIQECDILK